MKTQLKDAFVNSNARVNSEIPQWVSEMGLEWLYNLLAQFAQSESRWSISH